MKNRYKSATMLRDEAKDFMNGKYAGAIGVALILFAFNYLVDTTLQMIESILTKGFVLAGMVSDRAVLVMDIVYYVISLALSVVLAVFTIGMNLYYLKIGCRTQAAASDLFSGFKDNLSRSFAIAFRVNGVASLAMMPAMVMTSYYMSTRYDYALYAALGCMVVGVIIAVYTMMTYEMSYFIMHDFSEYTAGEVLAASRKKMKGNRWRLFRTEFSFIPYFILAIFTLGIGMLWVYPLMQETKARFYLDLMNPKKVSGEWERTV